MGSRQGNIRRGGEVVALSSWLPILYPHPYTVPLSAVTLTLHWSQTQDFQKIARTFLGEEKRCVD